MTELVVLLDRDGTAIGTADKATVHTADTPYHLAFSSYGFDAAGRALVTRRALDKRTFPGLWTNTCCGHPAPGERPEDAVVRRWDAELGVVPSDLTVALPAFSYRAEYHGVVEYELCPVYLCRVDAEPAPEPSEVAEYRWMPWDDVVDWSREPGFSPWARLQIEQLEADGLVRRFLARGGAA